MFGYIFLKKIIIILIFAILTLLIQVFFWNIFFGKLAASTNKSIANKNEKTTVLVCAKDEIKNLQTLIPELLKQNQQIEILIVDDFSTDDSLQFLDASANANSKITYSKCSKDSPGKKQALMDGFANIESGLILLTDADCKPASNNWSQLMSNALGDKDIVLGYSPYKKTTGFLNKWIRYEAILTAIQYLSFALHGKPYMGVGRNVLYRKSLVQTGESLKDSMHLASGDDDLLINSLAKKDNCVIQIDPDAWTYSVPKATWKEYFFQKKRHMSTASSYKFSDQLLLLLFSLSWICFYISIIYFLAFGFWEIGLLLLLIRLLTGYISVFRLFPKLDGNDLIAHWWYLDPFTAVYFLIFSIFAIIPQRNTW